MFCIYSNFNSVNLRLNICTGWPVFTKLRMNVVLLVSTTKLFADAFAKLQKCVCLSVWNNSAPTGRIFMKFDVLLFFRKYVEKLHENNRVLYTKTCVCTYTIISGWILRRTRNLSQEICRENQNKYFMFSIFFNVNRAVCKIMWKSRAGQATDDRRIGRMHFAC